MDLSPLVLFFFFFEVEISLHTSVLLVCVCVCSVWQRDWASSNKAVFLMTVLDLVVTCRLNPFCVGQRIFFFFPVIFLLLFPVCCQQQTWWYTRRTMKGIGTYAKNYSRLVFFCYIFEHFFFLTFFFSLSFILLTTYDFDGFF